MTHNRNNKTAKKVFRVWLPKITTMFIKDKLLDLLMKRNLSFMSDFSETTMFLIVLLATSTVLIPLGLNQNQIAIAQQQKLQGFQNNQTSSSLTKQQQPTGISFRIDNMTFSHHMASVNGIQLHYVIGGHGDPVVLLHGWPETWYEWHLVMPALAKN